MGGAASSCAAARLAVSEQVTAAQLDGLGPPHKSPNDDDSMVFPCISDDPSTRGRIPVLLFEVSSEGFRLLRPDTNDALCMHPWGQVHSWSHTKTRFTFRFFDDGRHMLVESTLHMKDVDPILQRVQHVIDAILAERQAAALPEAQFTSLVEALQAATSSGSTYRGPGPMEVIQTRIGQAYVLADQGGRLVDLLTTNFDKVEAAVVLHGHLIDQSHFSVILDKLDCQEDRDNVWHRVTVIKKEKMSLTFRKQMSGRQVSLAKSPSASGCAK